MGWRWTTVVGAIACVGCGPTGGTEPTHEVEIRVVGIDADCIEDCSSNQLHGSVRLEIDNGSLDEVVEVVLLRFALDRYVDETAWGDQPVAQSEDPPIAAGATAEVRLAFDRNSDCSFPIDGGQADAHVVVRVDDVEHELDEPDVSLDWGHNDC